MKSRWRTGTTGQDAHMGLKALVVASLAKSALSRRQESGIFPVSEISPVPICNFPDRTRSTE